MKKISFWDLILEYFLVHFWQVLGYAFEVRFQRAYGPHFLWFLGSFWNRFWDNFHNLLKSLDTLKNATPSMRKLCFWISKGLDFHDLLIHFLRHILEPHFQWFSINYGCHLDSLFVPLNSLFWVAFFHHYFIARFFFGWSWGGGTWDTSQKRGELGTGELAGREQVNHPERIAMTAL